MKREPVGGGTCSSAKAPDLPVAIFRLPGGKSAGKEFSLPDGKLTFAKILPGPAKPVLRISVKGPAGPFNPQSVLFFRISGIHILTV